MTQAGWIVYQAVLIFLQILGWAIIIDMLLSWVLPPTNAIRGFLQRIVGPLVRPFRGISRKIMEKSRLPMDFAPLMAYICLQILTYLVQYLVIWMTYG